MGILATAIAPVVDTEEIRSAVQLDEHGNSTAEESAEHDTETHDLVGGGRPLN